MPTSVLRFSAPALVTFVSLVALAGCGVDDDPLPTGLDPESNVVEQSPVDFAPNDGGVGMGTFNDDLPFTFVVLAQGALDNAGETNCGQFAADEDDLELSLYGNLKPGDWTLSNDQSKVATGTAELSLGGRSWASGKVHIDEGSEERGSEVKGSIDASTADGERFVMRFSTLMHGCGRE